MIQERLAAGQIPGFKIASAPEGPTSFSEAGDDFLGSLVRAGKKTRDNYRWGVNVAARYLGNDDVDQIGWRQIASMIQGLEREGYMPSSIRLIVKAVRRVFDRAEVKPNPARDPLVELPKDTSEEIRPPTADEIETVFFALPRHHKLPLLWLDWSGARVGAAIDKSRREDYESSRRRVLSRGSAMKGGAPHFDSLPPAIARALDADLASYPADSERLFPHSSSAALRTAIRTACKKTGTRHFSPHRLRHRRISLLHAKGWTWARIGEFVAQKSFSTQERTYTHVILDMTELDYERLLRDY